jgi:hypothetical protein
LRPEKKFDNAIEFAKAFKRGCDIAELGVWRGRFAERAYRLMQPRRMYLVDWWAPYSNSGGDAKLWASVEKDARNRFAKEVKSKRVTIIKDDFVAAAIAVPNQGLDFIRHDGDEREHCVKAALNAWWRTLKVGGLWMGHGFDNEPLHGTIPAVVSFLRARHDVEFHGILKDCSHYILRKTA